jgi:general secretion pathway protein L
MVRISEAVPTSMTHDIEELEFQKQHAVLHGIVGSIPDAQQIATNLRQDRCFQDVKITRTSQVVGGDKQKYLLEFDVKCPEDVRGTKKKESAAAAQTPGAASAAGATTGGK